MPLLAAAGHGRSEAGHRVHHNDIKVAPASPRRDVVTLSAVTNPTSLTSPRWTPTPTAA
jgi:hypothetical protein